jgi:hypothetical protein
MKKPNRAVREGRFDWLKQHRFDVEFAKRILLTTGECRPMFVIVGKVRSSVMPALWNSDDERDTMYLLMTLLAAADNAVGLVFIAEAWMRGVLQVPGETTAQTRERAMQVAPRDAEDRIEVIHVVCCYRDDAGEKQTLYSILEIERDATGKPTGTRPRNIEGISMESRLMTCLPPKEFSEDECELARRLAMDTAERAGIKLNLVHPTVGHA